MILILSGDFSFNRIIYDYSKNMVKLLFPKSRTNFNAKLKPTWMRSPKNVLGLLGSHVNSYTSHYSNEITFVSFVTLL